MFMGLVRFQARLFSWRRKVDRSATRVAIVGAGVPGASIIREMLRSPASGRCPVVVVDDDVRAHGRSLLGVPVVGSGRELDRVVERFEAREVLVADPGADQTLLRTAMEGAERAKVPRQGAAAGPRAADRSRRPSATSATCRSTTCSVASRSSPTATASWPRSRPAGS